MKCLWLYLMGLLALMVTLAGCAPATVPPPPTPSGPTTPPAPGAPALSPQDAAWQKVIDTATRQEARLNIYSFHFIGDTGQAVATAFKERYGIDVQLVTGPGSLLMERMRSEKRAGQHIADLLTSAMSLIVLGKGEGLTTSFGEMPVFKEEGVWLISPRADEEGHLVSIGPAVFNPYINTQQVKKGEEPASFKDLLSPRWKGKLSTGNPDLIPNSNYLFWVFTERKILDENYFRALGQQSLMVMPDNRQDAAAVARGQSHLALAQSFAAMGPLAKEGAPILPVPMEEGTLTGGSSAMTMVANSPHPNAARLFTHWLMSAEGQKVFHRAQATLSMRTDIPDFTPTALRVKAKRVIPYTTKDETEVARLMRERTLSKLWKG